MKGKFLLVGAVAVVAVLAFAGLAGAAPVMPTLPISTYGDTLLSAITTALGAVWPYAAIFTGVGVLVGAVKSWIGRKKGTQAAH